MFIKLHLNNSLRIIKYLGIFLSLTLIPILLGVYILNLWDWDFSIPLAYGNPGADEIWQLVATKTLLDTGWILTNQFMGTPGISTWYANSASQISVIHQMLMLGISTFVKDAVKVQQYYFLLNFSLITFSTYVLARTNNIKHILAIGIGIIFSLTSYRLNSLFFAYLANYFFIPISLIPIYWIFQNKFTVNNEKDSPSSECLKKKNRRYLIIGSLISILTAISDGYYAFFYILLLCFAILFRLINGDIFRLRNLISPLILLFLVVSTSLAITAPLTIHRASHVHEADQDKNKQPTDAEVYSPTLKLLIAPISEHRIDKIGNLGEYLVETANFNRRFPYSNGAPVVLGTFGVISLVVLLTIGLLTARRKNDSILTYQENSGISCAYASSLLALFILLVSMTGGIGSLIAILFPAIRAYERFPIFLILILYLGIGSLISIYLDKVQGIRKVFISASIPVIVMIIVLDQTPRDLLDLKNPSGFKLRSERFLAERAFIKELEESVPINAMVYQFPYSQYLTNNKYYGWGQFGHLRAYLHSNLIRWSNGAARGSYVDDWHEHKADMPIESLLLEIQSAGFEGILVDRLVIKDEEFEILQNELNRLTGKTAIVNSTAKLAFWKLDKLPFQLTYSDDFLKVNSLTVFKKFDVNNTHMPRAINKSELLKILNANSLTSFPFKISSKTNPLVFDNHNYIEGSLGDVKVDVSKLKGQVVCDPLKTHNFNGYDNDIDLTIVNNSTFDWRLGYGNYPIKIGAIVTNIDGKVLIDTRIPAESLLRSGESMSLKLNTLEILSKGKITLPSSLTISIKLVQDANAWFEMDADSRCDLRVNI